MKTIALNLKKQTINWVKMIVTMMSLVGR
jgi:hypothetical protein